MLSTENNTILPRAKVIEYKEVNISSHMTTPNKIAKINPLIYAPCDRCQKTCARYGIGAAAHKILAIQVVAETYIFQAYITPTFNFL